MKESTGHLSFCSLAYFVLLHIMGSSCTHLLASVISFLKSFSVFILKIDCKNILF